MTTPWMCPNCSRRTVPGPDRAGQPIECPACHVAMIEAPQKIPGATASSMRWSKSKRHRRRLARPILLGLGLFAGSLLLGLWAFLPDMSAPAPLRRDSFVLVDPGQGGRWHVPGCGFRRPTAVEMTIDAAEAQGHVACSNCTEGRELPPPPPPTP